MGVSNGQNANQTTFNNGLLGRNSDDDTTGKIDLLNSDSSSLTDIQSNINGNAIFLGRSVNSGAGSLPTWGTNNVGISTNNVKARVDAMDLAFADLRPYIVDASITERGLVSIFAQSFEGNKTFEGDVDLLAALSVSGVGEFDSAVSFRGASILVEGIQGYGYVDTTTVGANATLPLATTSVIRLTGATLTGIDGITSLSGFGAGSIAIYINKTGNTVTLNNATGTANYQILTGTGGNVDILDDGSFLLFRDNDSEKWNLISGGGGGAGGGLPVRDVFTGTTITTTEDARQVWVYTGASAQTLSSIDVTLLPNQGEIEITGSDNTNTITIENDDTSGGVVLNGTWTGYKYSKLIVRWDSTLDRIIEVSRNGL